MFDVSFGCKVFDWNQNCFKYVTNKEYANNKIMFDYVCDAIYKDGKWKDI